MRVQLGKGVEADAAEAERWYRVGAERGNPDAQASLAETLWTNECPEEAAKWLRKAAVQSRHKRAQNLLGRMAEEGVLIPRKEREAQLKEALGWYRLAADQGLAGARVLTALAESAAWELFLGSVVAFAKLCQLFCCFCGSSHMPP